MIRASKNFAKTNQSESYAVRLFLGPETRDRPRPLHRHRRLFQLLINEQSEPLETLKKIVRFVYCDAKNSV
jgi:hypothetical protein